MRFINRKTQIEEELGALENYLRVTLQPIAPRPEFIDELRRDLKNSRIHPIVRLLPDAIQKGILVVGGVLGGILVFWTAIRGLISLLGMVSVLVVWIQRRFQRTQQVTAT
jgi:hypothetical protein